MSLFWGIAGASKISHDFCFAINSNLTTVRHEIKAIASRSKKLAENFAEQHGIPNAYGSYLDLAKDTEVKVVYVAVLNPQHYEVSKMMIEHGKHVVCEKPFAMNAAQAEKIAQLAACHSVFLMEGLWSRFFPVYRHLDRQVLNNAFVDIREIYIKHGFRGLENERIIQKALGGGIVLDIGCYAIQFVLFIFREPPISINATGKVNKNGVDLQFEADLTFSNRRKAKITCSGLEELDNQATIITTKGAICVPQYWCPTQCVGLGQMHQWDLISVSGDMHYTNSVGLKYEADEVINCVRSGKLQCEIVTHTDTIIIAKIQDEIRKQIGVTYDCDKVF